MHKEESWSVTFPWKEENIEIITIYTTLSQNAPDITTKCDSHFITKCDKSLLKNVSGFLLQNATILFQNATFITKRNVHYQNVSVQW